MELPVPDIESELPDLSDCSLEDLRSRDEESLAASLDRLLSQVHRPRGNFAGSGSPDRVD
jgi:FXSXX-COOH protein